MRKMSMLLLGLISGFAILGFSPIITANAATPYPHLNFLAVYIAGIKGANSTQNPLTDDFIIAILQNNVGFAFGAIGHTNPNFKSVAHAWYAHLGLSKYVETRDSPFYALNVEDIKSVGSIFPGILEAYNDTNGNGICDTWITTNLNGSEVVYYLHMKNYGAMQIMDLTPKHAWEFRAGNSAETFTWGMNYTNVVIDVYNGVNLTWNATKVAIKNMDYFNISYVLNFTADGNVNLSQNFHFGNVSNAGNMFQGLGLSVIQFNFAQSLSFDLLVNTQARNETGHIISDPENTTFVRTATIFVGMSPLVKLDLSTAKPTYILNGTDTKTANSSSAPWYTAVYSGYFNDGTYDHNGKWVRVVTAFQYRICYNEWNGYKIDHDPIYGLTTPLVMPFDFTINKTGWMSSAILGLVFGIGAACSLIGIIVVRRRNK